MAHAGFKGHQPKHTGLGKAARARFSKKGLEALSAEAKRRAAASTR